MTPFERLLRELLERAHVAAAVNVGRKGVTTTVVRKNGDEDRKTWTT